MKPFYVMRDQSLLLNMCNILLHFRHTIKYFFSKLIVYFRKNSFFYNFYVIFCILFPPYADSNVKHLTNTNDRDKTVTLFIFRINCNKKAHLQVLTIRYALQYFILTSIYFYIKFMTSSPSFFSFPLVL